MLEGHAGSFFWITEPDVIPAWLFAIPLVLPFTAPAAIILCVGSAWFARRVWKRDRNRIVSFIGLGLVGSLPFPFFLTVLSLRSTFEASEYGVTHHDQLLFLLEHWVAAGGTGVLGGLFLALIWRTNQTKEDANQRLEATRKTAAPFSDPQG
jgi:hypothetical protein